MGNITIVSSSTKSTKRKCFKKTCRQPDDNIYIPCVHVQHSNNYRYLVEGQAVPPSAVRLNFGPAYAYQKNLQNLSSIKLSRSPPRYLYLIKSISFYLLLNFFAQIPVHFLQFPQLLLHLLHKYFIFKHFMLSILKLLF